MAENYEPRPGDEVLVTARMTVDINRDFYSDMQYDSTGEVPVIIRQSSGIVVGVVPVPVPIPALRHAVIRARLTSYPNGEVFLLSHVEPGLWHGQDGEYDEGNISQVVEVLYPGVPS